MLSRESFAQYWKDPAPEAQREIKGTVLISREEKVEASNISTGAKLKLSVIAVAGDMNLATPYALMWGGFASDEDEKGCVISRKVAEVLFGTHQVAGAEIQLEENTYTIRGVVDMEEPVCMLQGEKGTAYHEARINAPGIPISSITQLLASCLPETYSRISEGGLYAGIARLAVFLPVWVLMIALFREVNRRAKVYINEMEDGTRKKEYLSTLYGVLFPIIAFAGICLLLLVTIHFSDDYVPTAWSDFAFWGELFTEKWKQTYVLLKADLSFADWNMLRQTVGCMLSSVACSVSMLSLLNNLRYRGKLLQPLFICFVQKLIGLRHG